MAPALLLMDVGAPDVIYHSAEMPDAAGTYESVSHDVGVVGRGPRVVDAADSPDSDPDPDPDRDGRPVIYAWIRLRDDPGEVALRRALMAQALPHWTVAAAMRPHPRVGLSMAHASISAAILSIFVA